MEDALPHTGLPRLATIEHEHVLARAELDRVHSLVADMKGGHLPAG